MLIVKIVSGGRTGGDRCALEAAVELGFPYGGLVSEGRRADESSSGILKNLHQSDIMRMFFVWKGQSVRLKFDYKWLMLALLSVTYLLEQGTRQIYNATLPQIRLDYLHYGVTDAQLGMVGTVFGAVIGIAILFAGLAAEAVAKPSSAGEARTPPLRRCGVSPHHDRGFATTSAEFLGRKRVVVKGKKE